MQHLEFVNKEEKIKANYIPKTELLQKAAAELNGVSDSFDVSVKGDNPDGGLGVQTAESNTAKTHKIMKECWRNTATKKHCFDGFSAA